MSILVATDFSPCSSGAVRLAASLAGRRSVPLWVVHAVEPLPFGDPVLPVVPAGWASGLLTAAEESIGREAKRLEEEGLSVKTRIIVGQPAHVVLDLAREHHVDLIVVGTHGRKGSAHLFLGSVAETIARRSECPVLVARAPAAHPDQDPLRSILIAVDLSPASRNVIAAAYELLRARGGRVELCTVHEVGVADALTHLPLAPRLEDEERATLESYLQSLVPPDVARSGISTHVSVLEGATAAEAILAGAQRSDVDLIAVGSHGRSGLKRALLGSVAEEVVRNSRRPVLLVRSRADHALPV